MAGTVGNRVMENPRGLRPLKHLADGGATVYRGDRGIQIKPSIDTITTMHLRNSILSIYAASLLSACAAPTGNDVTEPPRSLPVVHEVDVVVVGGSSGGVAAAVEAARNGVRVFLAAPRTFLGEDICSTYQPWLEPGEIPNSELARELFKPDATVIPPSAPFAYTASLESGNIHKDSVPPSRLSDGKWSSAANESVQFDGDVVLGIDLGREQKIQKVHVMAYQRDDEFEVASVHIDASTDQKDWQPLAVLENDRLGQGSHEDMALDLSAPAMVQTRYLRLEVKKGPQAKRMLLGEIVIEEQQPVGQKLAGSTPPQVVKPMQIKRVLDQALVQAKVPFLFVSYVTDVLRDRRGQPAGIVIANRSGRQAVIAKVIIDATEQGAVARLAKASFTAYPSGIQTFRWNVVGGRRPANDNLSVVARKEPIMVVDRKGVGHPVTEYRVRIPMRDGNFAAYAEAEQWSRDLTWTQEQVDASEVPFLISPDHIRSREPQTGAWAGAGQLAIKTLQPERNERIFVLGGCADLSREAAAELVRPLNLMRVGERVGKAAAALAKSLPQPDGGHLPGATASTGHGGEVREIGPETSPRQIDARRVPAERQAVPVLGEYDVVVVGGGTGGSPAAISAGRRGARTLLIEYLHTLGGVGTAGYISSYYYGNRVGFTQEVDAGMAAFNDPETRRNAGWNPDWKSEWYRRELRKARVDLWLGTLGIGAYVENGRVRGVVVATPQGRGVVLAKMVIDSTGNADIAAAAGAPCRYTDDGDIAVQGAGLPPRELGGRYTNTDYNFVDDTDILDIWRTFVTARQKFASAYDLGQLVDTRERRQVLGEFTLSPMDMMLGRTFPDTVVITKSNFDTHGYTIHPMFLIRPPDRKEMAVRLPFRCLIPRGLDRILVTGLGVSAHRDALPVIRMQADIQNQGYACGVAASMIVEKNCAVRELDIKALQQNLVEKGILPESVLTETDSFPMPRERLIEAVSQVAHEYDELEVLLTNPEAAKPLLREALAHSNSPPAQLVYAHILGMLGDSTGAQILSQAVVGASWDTGWNYTGMGQYGMSLSPLDSLLIALGRSGDKRGLGPILAKADALRVDSEFSHFRAVAMALESLADPAAAKPLATLLQKPGVSGHAVTNIEAALRDNPASATDTSTRNRALTELILARALYRCGDDQGLGERILKQYAQDLHGHYARHARAVLDKGPFILFKPE